MCLKSPLSVNLANFENIIWMFLAYLIRCRKLEGPLFIWSKSELRFSIFCTFGGLHPAISFWKGEIAETTVAWTVAGKMIRFGEAWTVLDELREWLMTHVNCSKISNFSSVVKSLDWKDKFILYGRNLKLRPFVKFNFESIRKSLHNETVTRRIILCSNNSMFTKFF